MFNGIRDCLNVSPEVFNGIRPSFNHIRKQFKGMRPGFKAIRIAINESREQRFSSSWLINAIFGFSDGISGLSRGGRAQSILSRRERNNVKDQKSCQWPAFRRQLQ